MRSAGIVELDAVIATRELEWRPCRLRDEGAESKALVELTRELAKAPHSFFNTLVEAALALTNAESTGISLLDETAGRFHWPAVAGRLSSYIGEGTPSDFGPCGTVLHRDETLLFQHPERHFTYLESVSPQLEEALLVPFYGDGRAVGTIWAVIHETGRKFDAEDRRLLEILSHFAASAYKVLTQAGALKPFLTRGAGLIKSQD